MSLPTEEDYKVLQERVIQAKVDILMEEPCPLYDEEDDYASEDVHYG